MLGVKQLRNGLLHLELDLLTAFLLEVDKQGRLHVLQGLILGCLIRLLPLLLDLTHLLLLQLRKLLLLSLQPGSVGQVLLDLVRLALRGLLLFLL